MSFNLLMFSFPSRSLKYNTNITHILNFHSALGFFLYFSRIGNSIFFSAKKSQKNSNYLCYHSILNVPLRSSAHHSLTNSIEFENLILGNCLCVFTSIQAWEWSNILAIFSKRYTYFVKSSLTKLSTISDP